MQNTLIEIPIYTQNNNSQVFKTTIQIDYEKALKLRRDFYINNFESCSSYEYDGSCFSEDLFLFNEFIGTDGKFVQFVKNEQKIPNKTVSMSCGSGCCTYETSAYKLTINQYKPVFWIETFFKPYIDNLWYYGLYKDGFENYKSIITNKTFQGKEISTISDRSDKIFCTMNDFYYTSTKTLKNSIWINKMFEMPENTKIEEELKKDLFSCISIKEKQVVTEDVCEQLIQCCPVQFLTDKAYEKYCRGSSLSGWILNKVERFNVKDPQNLDMARICSLRLAFKTNCLDERKLQVKKTNTKCLNNSNPLFKMSFKKFEM